MAARPHEDADGHGPARFQGATGRVCDLRPTQAVYKKPHTTKQTNKQKQQTHGNLLNRECESKKIRTLPCAHDALPAMNDYMGGRILRGNQPGSSVTGTASSAIVPLI